MALLFAGCGRFTPQGFRSVPTPTPLPPPGPDVVAQQYIQYLQEENMAGLWELVPPPMQADVTNRTRAMAAKLPEVQVGWSIENLRRGTELMEGNKEFLINMQTPMGVWGRGKVQKEFEALLAFPHQILDGQLGSLDAMKQVDLRLLIQNHTPAILRVVEAKETRTLEPAFTELPSLEVLRKAEIPFQVHLHSQTETEAIGILTLQGTEYPFVLKNVSGYWTPGWVPELHRRTVTQMDRLNLLLPLKQAQLDQWNRILDSLEASLEKMETAEEDHEIWMAYMEWRLAIMLLSQGRVSQL